MRFLVKMMVPEEITVEADTIREAGAEARRLRDALDDPEGNHTITLLSVTPIKDTQNGAEDTQP